jgi:membrane-bound lytic murein transglycosylase D
VPAGRQDALLAQLESVPVWTPPVPKYTTHRVRSGETLSTIAGRYRTSVSAIMKANGLRSANRLRIGQRLRIPTRGGEIAAGGS